MATDPQFASTISLGSALLGATAETDTLAPAQTSVIVTAGTNGTKIETVFVQAAKTGTLVATTVNGFVYLFLYDGSVYHLFDTITVVATVASTTVGPFHAEKLY